MARIRTVKPEFWGHPILARLSDCTRLMALALLNMADDEGYFLADPALVRNFARPFDEDSRNTTVAIRELSNVGWIEVRSHPSHGLIAWVVNFAKHQVVNHPSPSKLKTYFSGSVPVMLPEGSGNVTTGNREQGTGIREQGSGSRDQGVQAPSELPPSSQGSLGGPPGKKGVDKPGKLDDSKILVSVECVGTGPHLWPLSQARMDEWVTAFPGIDVPAKVRAAIVWLRSNPKKRKTFNGMPNFFASWLIREQNRSRPPAQGASNGTPSHRSSDLQSSAELAREHEARVAATSPSGIDPLAGFMGAGPVVGDRAGGG